MSLKASHILSVDQFDREQLTHLFRVAEQMRPYANREKLTKVLDGAILGNMFFEASTRTRVSFGCAFNLLGGFVRETVGIHTSSLSKGESLYDTARVMSGYSDIIVMRHPEPGSVQEFAKASRVPVINGGDGPNEHPSQALLDLFTIQKEMKRQDTAIDGLKIAMIGDLKHGRTVHSLSLLLSLFNDIEFFFIAPSALNIPDKILNVLDDRGHKYTLSDRLEDGLRQADIVYQTRIQEERFESKAEADQYRGAFRINQHTFSQFCQASTVIMHPLPRDSRADANELDIDLDEHPQLAIFRQSDNGVLVRMAMFAIILGVEKDVEKYSMPIRWHSAKKV